MRFGSRWPKQPEHTNIAALTAVAACLGASVLAGPVTSIRTADLAAATWLDPPATTFPAPVSVSTAIRVDTKTSDSNAKVGETFTTNNDDNDSGVSMCHMVRDAEDKCAFAKRYCGEDSPGMTNYIEAYYCAPSRWEAWETLGLTVLWLACLFMVIGMAAYDYLCPNLNTMASILGLSESIVGVTFLAFGNGAPDMFSTYAAVSAGSGSLAIGELIGAACFIVSVVAGSMAVTRPFRVVRSVFLRDTIFLLSAIGFSLYFISDGVLYAWECVVMLLLYVTYVFVVAFSHWRRSRRLRAIMADALARNAYAPPGEEEPMPEDDGDGGAPLLEAHKLPDISALTLEEPEAGYAEINRLMRVPRGSSTTSFDHQHLHPHHHHHSHHHQPGHATPRTPMRTSLYSAIEFREVLGKLNAYKHAHDEVPLSARLSGYSDTHLSARAQGLPPRAPSPRAMSPADRRRQDSVSPTAVGSPSVGGGHLPPQPGQPPQNGPDAWMNASPASPATVPRVQQSRGTKPQLRINTELDPDPAFMLQSPETAVSCAAPEPRRASPLLPPAWLEPGGGRDEQQQQQMQPQIVTTPVGPDHEGSPTSNFSEIDELLKPKSSLPEWVRVLFPTLDGISSKSWPIIMMNLLATPWVVLLTCTIPVYESDPLEDEARNDSVSSSVPPPSIVLADAAAAQTAAESEAQSAKAFNIPRFLLLIHCWAVPLTVAFFTGALSSDGHWFLVLLLVALASIACTVVVLRTTLAGENTPVAYKFLSFVGFAIAVLWVAQIATEVVAILKALGIILNLSEAILGLTVFAIGNSLGDLVSNVTIARMGFPRMALAACFGGPLLNILVGVGVSCLVVLVRPEHRTTGYIVEISPNILVSGLTALLVLLFLFFAVRLNHWNIARWMGLTTICMWILATAVNIIFETTTK